MMLDANYFTATGPNGRLYVRSKRDRSVCISVAAFLAFDFYPEAAKRRLRLLTIDAK